MVKIDVAKCIGCGACVSICPSVFGLKDGKAFVKSSKREDCIKDAIESCPVSAIAN